MKCDHCPVDSGVCHGESVRRMCELMDPGHPDHNPAYGPALVAMAATSGDPSLATRGATLARELWAWAVSGFRLAGEPGRRLAICEACEHFDAAPRQCRLCTCYMDLKVHLQTAQCPVGKW